MEGSVGAPPQRVCPKCARISWAQGPRCPYCRARFRRQNIGVIAWMLTLAVVVVLGGVLAMLVLFGRHVNDQVDDRANKIERQFNDIRSEIDRRLPQNGVVPTATPLPTETPTPTPTETPSPTGTATATATPRETATATQTPSSPSGSGEAPSGGETRP